uniref:ribosomal protein S14 n=1 Tax=Scleria parvula TaxID=388579 RepID=UPI001F140042|nr:ribosomal protein S14 [Scleria parvula]ULQ67660.1 ribosomal protein S14 [Scleria parvula]
MAKKSLIQRENKRKKLEEKYRLIRQSLKKEKKKEKYRLISQSLKKEKTSALNLQKKKEKKKEKTSALNLQKIKEIQKKLQSLPRNSAPIRLHRRCLFTGRSRANYRDFGLSGHILREMVRACLLPGATKSSW